MRKRLLSLAIALCVLILAAHSALRPFTSLECPDSTTGSAPDGLYCGTGGNPIRACIAAVYSVPGIPLCPEECTENTRLACLDQRTLSNAPVVSLFFDPFTGLWTCCILVQNSSYTVKCDCA